MGIALLYGMKIIVMQCGWVTYEVGQISEEEARQQVKRLYQRHPEATIYIDRGRGWEFVDPHRAAAFSMGAPPASSRSDKTRFIRVRDLG